MKMPANMSPLLRTGLLIAALMFAATALAVVMRPTHKIADQSAQIDLENLIPREFGDWREEKLVSTQIVDPLQKEMLDRIYSQMLSRTYANAEGYRIMLSIAYGGDQRDAMQVHKPEVCYPAQGFVLENKTSSTIAHGGLVLPVTRVTASMGQRREPITYWTTVGDQVIKSGVHKKLVEMSYGLTGKIPDGMLVRVSSIDPDVNRAFRIQDGFAAQMIESIPPALKKRLTGTLQEHNP